MVRFGELSDEFLKETLVIVALKDEDLRNSVIQRIHDAGCPNYMDGEVLFQMPR